MSKIVVKLMILGSMLMAWIIVVGLGLLKKIKEDPKQAEQVVMREKADEMIHSIRYIKDRRTNICFAYVPSNPDFSRDRFSITGPVQCSLVMEQLDN